MTMTDHSTVVGVFTDRVQAGRAIEALRRAGFTDEQVGFVRRGEDKGTTDGETRTDEGANFTSGVIGGGALGGILGAVAALLIPGFGPAIAGGILAAVLGGAAIGAAAGGIIGALTNMGVPEEEARYYQGEFESGNMIVTVKVAGRQQEAMTVLRQYGAYDATSRAGTYNANAAPGTYGSTSSTQANVNNPAVAVGTYGPNMTQGSGSNDPNAPSEAVQS